MNAADFKALAKIIRRELEASENCGFTEQAKAGAGEVLENVASRIGHIGIGKRGFKYIRFMKACGFYKNL